VPARVAIMGVKRREQMAVLSLGDFLWSLLIIFFMVVYFMMLFQVVVDVFRRKDASGAKKAIWLIALLIFPLAGLLVYILANGQSMTERGVQDMQRQQRQFDDHVRDVAGGSAAEIERAKALLDSGAISQAEFERLKAKALA
jgi:predicted PurR-regulated permease PerM